VIEGEDFSTSGDEKQEYRRTVALALWHVNYLERSLQP